MIAAYCNGKVSQIMTGLWFKEEESLNKRYFSALTVIEPKYPKTRLKI